MHLYIGIPAFLRQKTNFFFFKSICVLFEVLFFIYLVTTQRETEELSHLFSNRYGQRETVKLISTPVYFSEVVILPKFCLFCPFRNKKLLFNLEPYVTGFHKKVNMQPSASLYSYRQFFRLVILNAALVIHLFCHISLIKRKPRLLL